MPRDAGPGSLLLASLWAQLMSNPEEGGEESAVRVLFSPISFPEAAEATEGPSPQLSPPPRPGNSSPPNSLRPPDVTSPKVLRGPFIKFS